MDIQTLHNNISQAVTNNSLSITTALMNSTSYTNVSEQYNISSIHCGDASVGAVSGNQFEVSTSAASIYIGTDTINGLPVNASSLIFSIENSEAQLTVTFTLNSSWKLKESFSLLTDTFVNNLPITYTNLVFSSLSQLITKSNTCNPGFSIKGSLSLSTSAFVTLEILYPEINNIAVGLYIGSLKPQTSVQLFSDTLSDVEILKAKFINSQISVTSLDPPTDEENPVPTINYITTLDIGLPDNNTVKVVGAYPILTNTVALKGSLSSPLSLTQGLDALSHLFSDVNLTSVLPSVLQNIGNTIALKSIGLSFYLNNKNSLFSTEATLVITKAFQLFPSLSILSVESLEFTWYVYNPFDSNRSINFHSISTVKIGNTYEVDLTIGKNNSDYFLTISSVEGQQLSLRTLLDQFKVPADLFPSLSISQFQFFADLSKSDYFFSITLSENWEFKDIGISLTEVFLSCNYTKSTSSFAAEASATFVIPNTESKFILDGKKDSGWEFSGSYEGDSISMAQLLSDLNKGWNINIDTFPKVFKDISISSLNFSINTNTNTFTFHIEGSIKILDNDFNLLLDITIQKIDGTYYYSLGGQLAVAGELFELQISDLNEQTALSASWKVDGGQPLNINHILSQLGISAISLPNDVNLALTMKAINFTYDSKQVALQLTNSEDFTAAFGTETIQNERKYYFAIALGEDYSISNLCSGLSFFNGITFHKLFVAISDFTDANFQIPSTPYKGITQGIDFRAQMTMASSQGTTGIGKTVNFLGQSFGANTLDIAINLSKTDFELIGTLTGVDIPFISSSQKIFTLKNIGVTIKTSPITLELDCDVNLNYNFKSEPPVNDIHIKGSLAFIIQGENATIQMSIFEDTTISKPLGISILTINNIGFAIAGEVGPLSGIDFTLQGKIVLGDPTSQSLIQETFGASIAFEDDIINIPYFESDTTGDITITKIWNACIPSLPVPSFLNVIEIDELDFYFCDQPITLPSGQAVSIGTSFLAAFSIWNFHTFCSLLISPTKIAGKLEMDPLDLKVSDITILTIKGNGQGDPKYNIQSGGAEISFDTDKAEFDATLITTFLGLEESVNASLSESGFSFSLQSNLLLDAAFSCTLKDEGYFSAGFKYGPDFTVQLPTKLGHELGSINIHDTINASLALSVKPTDIKFNCNGGFDLQGLTFEFGPFAVDVNITSVEGLLNAIVQYIKDNAGEIFKKLLEDGALWAKWVKDGIITGVKDIAKVLKDAFGYGEKELTSLLHSLGYDASYIANALKDLFGSNENEIASYLAAFFTGGPIAVALKALGYGPDAIAGALHSVSEDAKDIAKSMMEAGYGAEVIGAALYGISYGIDAITEALKYIDIGAQEIVGVLKIIGYGVEDVVNSVGKFFTDILPDTFNDILQGAGYAAEAIASAFETIGGAFADFASSVWDTAKEIFDPTEW